MPHATAGRPEQVPRAPAAGQHAHRGRRAEPVQLAGGRDRPGPGAAPAGDARAGSGGAAAAAATLAAGGLQGRADRKSVVEGKSVDLGGRRIIKKKKDSK